MPHAPVRTAAPLLGVALLASIPANANPLDALGPILRLQSAVVDDSGGNGDGWIQPGEMVQLEVTLHNFGATPAFSVYGQLNLVEPNPYVVLLDKVADFPNVPAGSSVTSNSPHFLIQVSNVVPCGAKVRLSLEIASQGAIFTAPLVLDLRRPLSYDLVEDADRRYDEADSVIYGRDPGDGLGIALAYGDVNGDGFDDLVVGAEFADGLGNIKTETGEVWVLYGSNAGLPPVTELMTPPFSAASVIHGADDFDHLGRAVATGDFDGDGYADVVMSSVAAAGSTNGDPNSGEVWVLYGKSAVLTLNIDLFVPPAESTVIYGADASDRLGSAMAVGDINGDGFDDLMVGAPWSDSAGNSRNQAGEVWLFLGSPGRFDPVIDLASPPATAVLIYGPDAGDFFGGAIAAGDLDGDPYDDFLVAAHLADGPSNGRSNAGEVWRIPGGPLWLGVYDPSPTPLPGWTRLFGAAESDDLGRALAVSDLDRDGLDEVIASAHLADGPEDDRSDAGEVWMLPWTTASDIDLFTNPAEATVVYGRDENDFTGQYLATGDLDGDGFVDVLLSSMGPDGPGNTRPEAGEAWILWGGADPRPVITDLLTPSLATTAVWGAETTDAFGPIAAGDFDGDGLDDLAVGGWQGDGDGNLRIGSGEVQIIDGKPRFTYWHARDAYGFIDASSGVQLPLACDDCSTATPIGFSFPFYGETFDTVYVSSNGFLSFVPIDDDLSAAPRCIWSKSPSSLSSLPLVVAPFWDDLDLSSSGAVYAQLSGTAPDRRLTVEWLDVPHYPNTGAVTFEVSLFESTGQILFQYQDVSFGQAVWDAGASAVVGVQNRTGAEGTNYGCSDAILQNDSALAFRLTTPLFVENVESVDFADGKTGMWEVLEIGAGPSVWHDITATSCVPDHHGRVRSFYAGNDAICQYTRDIVQDLLRSPIVGDFPADGRLTWWQRFQASPGDYGEVQIDDGVAPTVLANHVGILDGGNWHAPDPIFLPSHGSFAGTDSRIQFDMVSDSVDEDLGFMVDDIRLTGCNAVGVGSVTTAFAYGWPTVWCGDGSTSGQLDAVGSTCGDGSAPLGYQWFENGAPIPGETNVTLTIPPNHPSGTFTFSVEVTCPAGTDMSTPVVVQIVEPPADVGPTLMLAKASGGTEVVYSWASTPGADEYHLLQDQIASGPFTQVTGVTATPSLTTPMPPGYLIFYRVVGANAVCGEGPW